MEVGRLEMESFGKRSFIDTGVGCSLGVSVFPFSFGRGLRARFDVEEGL